MLCRACGDPHPDGTATCPRMDEPTPVTSGPCNTQIDRYLIERFLGGGGMGAVYRARHVMLDQLMALKLLKAGLADKKEVLDRFVREARAAAAIGNPHIVRVSDFGIAPDGRAFLAMELLDGRDVEQTLRAAGPFEPGRAVGIALQVLDGLGAAHAAGIIHRDLKPANIFLLPSPGGGELVKIVDFGVSKMGMGAHLPSLTQTGGVVGTPLYMAPEQFRGARDVDARADLYAVGVTLYEMLAARPPWEAPTYEALIVQIYTEAPRPLRQLLPGVPPPLEAAVARALAREPSARFQSAAEMAEALRGAATAARLVVPPPPALHLSGGMTAQRPPSFVGASMAAPQLPTPLGTPSATPSPNPNPTPGPYPVPNPVQYPNPYPVPYPNPSPNPPPNPNPSPNPNPPARKSRGLLWAVLLLVLASAGIATAVVVANNAPAAALAGDAGPTAIPTATVPTPTPPPPRPADTVKPPAPDAPIVIDARVAGPAPDARRPVDAPAAKPLGHDAASVPPKPGPAEATAEPPPPKPAPPPRPPRPAESVVFDEPRVVGDLDVAPLEEAIDKVRPQLEKCRLSTKTEKVAVQFHVAFSQLRLAAPAADNQGPANIATCIANRVRGAHPRWPNESQSGILIVEVTVAPKP